MDAPDTTQPDPAAGLRFEWRGSEFDYGISGDLLTAVVSTGSSSRATHTPLWRLASAPVVDSPRSAVAAFQARRFRYALVCGLIVEFSEIPRFIPYLAPALYAFAVFCLIKAARCFPAIQQTRFVTEYGEEIIAIPHLSYIEKERLKFEEQLREAIYAAKTQAQP